MLLNLHSRTIFSVSIHDQLIIATAGADNAICILQLFPDSPKGTRLKVLCKIENAHNRDVNCVNWCKVEGYKNYLGSCGDDGIVKLWKYVSD